MGLAAPKRRNKLSHDPNNTGWSNSVDNYGQKILSAQGWKPGDYLGARDASHAEHYTAANKAHIKILLREDNLGLGAQVGKSNAETFGLSLYSGVLSRLNGRSDAEVEKQQAAMRDAELRTYQADKYGFMNFVRGGVLVGDTIEYEKTGLSNLGGREHGAKKRKLDAQAGEGSNCVKAVGQIGRTSETLMEDSKEDGSSADSSEAPARRKKSKRKGREYSKSERQISDAEPDNTALKLQKRARKEERRKRKEEKRKTKAEKKAIHQEQTSGDAQARLNKTTAEGSRHAVRQRYIHQKRMASLDPQAMREIFMMQAVK